MSDTCAKCGHLRCDHDMFECRGKDWWDGGDYRCHCAEFVAKEGSAE